MKGYANKLSKTIVCFHGKILFEVAILVFSTKLASHIVLELLRGFI